MNPFRTLLSLALLALATSGQAALAPVSQPQIRTQAGQAAALLGPDTWSRVLRIENTRAASGYPAVTFATVFEFGGILWFYCPLDGTQSLSTQFGRVESDKRDLSRLLRGIEPGFARYREEPPAVAAPAVPARGTLPNGCVIDSIAYGHARLAEGSARQDLQLLQLVLRIDGRLRSHMVLVFREGSARRVFDPAAPERLGTIPASTGRPSEDAFGSARAVAKWRGYPSQIVQARLWPFGPSLAVALRTKTPLAIDGPTVAALNAR